MRLAAIATLVPENRIAVEDCVLDSGGSRLEAKAFSRLFGIDNVAAFQPETKLESIVETLAADLESGAAFAASAPDVIICVQGIPGRADALAAALRHARKNLPFLSGVQTVFEMDQQNCSTLFWALDASQRLLSSGQARSIVIFAGDSLAQNACGDRYAPGCTAIGDAFAALLLDNRSGGRRIGDISLKTRGDYHAGRFGSPEEVGAFNAAHSALVRDILGMTGHDVRSGEPLLPHNVNRLSWSKFGKENACADGHVWLSLLPDTGHCYTLDAFLMLPQLFDEGHDSGTLISVGQGGFLAGCRVSAHESGRGLRP